MKRATLDYSAPTIVVRPVRPADAADVEKLIRERWGETVVVHGTQYFPTKLPGFVALHGRKVIGLLTYQAGAGTWEIVTMDSWRPGGGVGTALLHAVRDAAQTARVTRLWMTTTNDNLDALRFYQRRGFKLVAVHTDAVAASRELKPEIPAVGEFQIPIRDELELEFVFRPPARAVRVKRNPAKRTR